MNIFGVILLTYIMGVHIISVVEPIPFVGFFVTFLAFPLSIKLTFTEMYTVELYGILFGLMIKFNQVFQPFMVGITIIPEGPFQTVMLGGIIIGMVGALVTFPIIITVSSKFLAKRFTPKRIMVLLNE